VRPILATCALASFLAGLSGSILFIALPGIATEFHSDIPNLAGLGAALSLGSLVALPLAAIADRRHRGPVAALGIAGFSAASVLSALAPSVVVLGAARLVAVCFETLVFAVATSAAVEAVGPANRARAVSLLAISGGAGAAVSVIGYPLVAPHWRLLYGLAALGLPLAPLALRIPSPIAAVPGARGMRVLLQPPWRARLAALAAAAALASLLYEPANFFSVLFGSRRLALSPVTLSIVLALSGLAAVAGYVLGGAASDRYGRRRPAVLLVTLAALLAAISFSSSPTLYICANIAWSALAGAAVPVVEVWTAELVPARARVSALTATAAAAALGGVVGLQAVARAEPALGLAGTLWILAGAAIIGALALLALPETRGEALPD
jgi:MFS family permease